MKPCPLCGLEVQDTATRCPHCHGDILPPEDSKKITLVLDKSLVQWSKFLIWFLVLMWGGFVVVGVMFYGFKLDEAQKQISQVLVTTQQSLIEVQKARNDAQRDANEAKFLVEDLKTKLREVAALQVSLKTAQESLKQVFALDVGSTLDDRSGFNLVNLARSTQAVQDSLIQLEERVTRLAAREETGPAVVAPPNVKELSQTLGIEQTSTPRPEVESGQRQAYDLAFTVCILEDNACTEQPVDVVDKVIYRLDPRWFSAAEEVRLSPGDRFKLSLRVWGSTSVVACIYLKGEPKPIVRDGRMNLRETLTWGPADASGDCKDAG